MAKSQKKFKYWKKLEYWKKFKYGQLAILYNQDFGLRFHVLRPN